MPLILGKEKLVPTAVIRELTHGSFEHLSLKIDDAIAENASLFVGGSGIEVARIATFTDRVIVGASDGRVFSAPYIEEVGDIRIGHPEQIDVPVVDNSNAGEYINRFMMDVVNSLLTGKPDAQKESIVALMNLQESTGSTEELKDLTTLVSEIVAAVPAWKAAFRENIDAVMAHINPPSDPPIEVKYRPLYDGSLPEEKFPAYLEPAKRDLAVITSRLSTLEDKVTAVYSNLVGEKTVSEAQAEFALFSEGVLQEVHDLREHARIAIENEQCAMCVGQIHDVLAESLPDYEIATSFIEKMAPRFAA